MKKMCKNFELDQAYTGLSELLKSDAELPIDLGFKCLQNKAAIKTAAETFQKAVQDRVRYNSKDGETVSKTKDPAAYARCEAEINQLAEIEVEVDIQEVKRTELTGLKLQMKQLSTLAFFMREESLKPETDPMYEDGGDE